MRMHLFSLLLFSIVILLVAVAMAMSVTTKLRLLSAPGDLILVLAFFELFLARVIHHLIPITFVLLLGNNPPIVLLLLLLLCHVGLDLLLHLLHLGGLLL